MPVKRLKKHKLDVKVKQKKKIELEDLLPESRDFLIAKEDEKIDELMPEDADFQPQVKSDDDIQKEEKYKRMIMWSGVTFFMLLIGIFWVYNMSLVFKKTAVETAKNSDNKSWEDISKELNKAMAEIKVGADELKNIKNQTIVPDSAIPTANNPLPTADMKAAGSVLSAEEVKELKSELEKVNGAVKK